MARVLLIAYTTYESDGRVKRNAQALAARGDQVDVICLASECDGEPDGVGVMRAPFKRYRGASRVAYVRGYLRFFWWATQTARRAHRQNPYDLVVTCTMPDAIVLCALPLKLRGAKVILDVHDTMPELYQEKFRGVLGAFGGRALRLQERGSAALADRVLAVHDLHKQRLVEAGIPQPKIGVVMNAPDGRIFGPLAPPANGAARPFRMVCHGTLTRRLGLDTALRALVLLRGRAPDLRLEIIGSGDYGNELREQVKKLRLESQVVFRGEVAIERLPELLGGASVGLVPNLANRATHLMLPVKLLEYVSLGIPVISARLRTIEHYFDRGSIRYFKAGCACELADAVEEFYCRPELARKLAENAREAAQRISWSVERERLYSVVDSLVGSRPAQDGNPVTTQGLVKRARADTNPLYRRRQGTGSGEWQLGETRAPSTRTKGRDVWR